MSGVYFTIHGPLQGAFYMVTVTWNGQEWMYRYVYNDKSAAQAVVDTLHKTFGEPMGIPADLAANWYPPSTPVYAGGRVREGETAFHLMRRPKRYAAQ